MTMMTAVVVFTLLLLIVYLILFVRGLNRKKETEEVENAIDLLVNNEEQKYSEKNIFKFEHYIITKFNVPDDKIRTFVLAERAAVIALAVILYSFLGILGVTFFACIFIFIVMDNNKNDEIERSGVTHIQDTVAFMDFFTPQIASGSSATQAFNAYINKLDDDNQYKELLVEYINHKTDEDYSYETPELIKDITSVYEAALYNEKMGNSDYLYIIQEAKDTLFQKSVYYSDFNSKTLEVLKPIEMAYYIGVPAIAIMLYGSVGDFWFTIPGFITAIAVAVLFFCFKALCNKLAINTLHEIL